MNSKERASTTHIAATVFHVYFIIVFALFACVCLYRMYAFFSSYCLIGFFFFSFIPLLFLASHFTDAAMRFAIAS